MFARHMRSVALSVGLIGWLGCSTSPNPGGTGLVASGAGGSTTGAAGNTAGGPGTAGTGAAGAGQAGASGGGSGAAGATTSGTGGGSGAAGASTAGAAGATGGSVGAAGAGTAGAGTAGSGAAGAGTAGTTGAAGRPRAGRHAPLARAERHGGAWSARARPERRHGQPRHAPGEDGRQLGVSGGGFSSWLVKRGYHGVGASFGECNAPNLGAGRDAVGTCRMGEWKMISDQVTATVKGLATLGAHGGLGLLPHARRHERALVGRCVRGRLARRDDRRHHRPHRHARVARRLVRGARATTPAARVPSRCPTIRRTRPSTSRAPTPTSRRGSTSPR